ncbi:MAG: hypothetical protein DI527_02655 [Chelatococcus sp.]|nr:MAG: hypothetical protein DI527_02655 [Chelatococcus sp.]
MAIRIAHLSDIHFGKRFNLALWEAVKEQIVDFDPHLVIVSGDVVDDPYPAQLLAAKCELRELAAQANAKLVVVPGNHDVFSNGVNTPLTRRIDWFERIFFNDDTAAAEDALAVEYGETPGFKERYLPAASPLRGFRSLLSFRRRPNPPFESLIPGDGSQETVQRPGNCSAVLAMLDSNHPGQPIGFATGMVHVDDLVRLRGDLKNVRDTYLVRIAVVHHHLLPIAFTSGRLVGAEPLMVLHNAGTVLALLAEHRFDLVLHGHKHVAQYARLDLSPRDETGYPVAVVSAGSCALNTQDNTRGNCFNLLTISDNGRISVESLYFGGGRSPSRDDAEHNISYREPLVTTKRRAYTRSRERHSLHCRERLQDFEITETGDTRIKATLIGLKTAALGHPECRDHSMSLPRDSWFVDELLALDERLTTQGVGLTAREAEQANGDRGPGSQRFTISFPPGELMSRGISYAVSYASANSVNMSHWECEERAGPGPRAEGWDKGYVGIVVTHPIERLTITLKLPQSLSGIALALDCLCPKGYPDYKIDAAGDATFQGDASWSGDVEITDHERGNLHFDPVRGVWKAVIDSPMVGYDYRIAWRTPDVPLDKPVKADVLHQRRVLLDALDAEADNAPAMASFAVLARDLVHLFGQGGRAERHCVELFVYDSLKVALRPVLSVRSWSTMPMRKDFAIPLGRGIAGLAFQQGRIIPWAAASAESPFVKPIRYPWGEGDDEVEMRTMLSIPIFHPSRVNEERPPPWACVGVVSFGSSSDATIVPRLLDPAWATEAMEKLLGGRILAHACVDEILKSLDGVQP